MFGHSHFTKDSTFKERFICRPIPSLSLHFT
ncbi:UNVERIFIED_CONTAM: hypothetical protein NCL1_22640 [Trichonephila clavipes]